MRTDDRGGACQWGQYTPGKAGLSEKEGSVLWRLESTRPHGTVAGSTAWGGHQEGQEAPTLLVQSHFSGMAWHCQKGDPGLQQDQLSDKALTQRENSNRHRLSHHWAAGSEGHGGDTGGKIALPSLRDPV